MSNPGKESLEIERRFLISMPEKELLRELGADCREITQTYLLSSDGWSSERIRMSRRGESVIFTHTKKRRISHATALEAEQEITAEQYRALLLRADPTRGTLRKRRHTFTVGGQIFEIDVYPFWKRTAILEAELVRACAPLAIPEQIKVIREVTGDGRYSNHALALAAVDEP